MSGFADILAASRRLFLLRLLVEIGGEANESVLTNAARHGGFAQVSRDHLRGDLDHLRDRGALSEEWMGALRVVRISERGEDAAYGRVTIDGVEHSIWRRNG